MSQTQNICIWFFIDQLWKPIVNPLIWGFHLKMLWSEVDQRHSHTNYNSSTLNQTVLKFTWAHTAGLQCTLTHSWRASSVYVSWSGAPWETWWMKTLIRLRVQAPQHHPVCAPSPWKSSFAHRWLSAEGQCLHRQHSSAHGHGPAYQPL